MLRKSIIGATASACLLAGGVAAVAQITNGVPSARQRAGAPETRLALGWDQKILVTGAQALENPVGIFQQYGYLNDAAASQAGCASYTPQTSGLKTKTEPDQNTYVTTAASPGGPTASYDYGRHFLLQGHEVFSNTGSGVGQTNAAYLTRINLDVPRDSKHRITLLGFPAGADNCASGMASIDGSTYDPFTGDMLFTGEAGGTGASSQAYGGLYATPLNWTTTTAPAVQHSALQGSMGYAGYEGVQVDDAGRLYLEEDTGGSTIAGSGGVRAANSFVFRFVPTNPNNLTAGKLQALQVSVDGTPLTFANQNAVSGTPDKRLYSGETLQANWVTVHDTATSTVNFDANAAAKAANATPFKRPENGRFFPGSGFKSFAFTVTGDTSATAIAAQTPDGAAQADRGVAGAIMRIDMPSSGADTATVRAIVPGDGEHNSYDSISFLDKDTLLVGEDRGEGLHTALNALDSTWSFDLTQSYGQTLGSAQRFIAQGRDPESLDDVNKKEATPAVADQNDGDNEVTGVLVSNGVSTTSSVFGAIDPATQFDSRAFYTGQHGANVTYELLRVGLPTGPTGPTGANGAQGPTGTTGPRGTTGPAGAAGTQGYALPGPQGAQGPKGNRGKRGKPGRNAKVTCKAKGKKVTCKVKFAGKGKRSATLSRAGRTVAVGSLSGRKVTFRSGSALGGRYTLRVGRRVLKVTVR